MCSSDLNQIIMAGSVQGMSKDCKRTLLHAAESGDEGQQSGLSGPGRSCQQHNFPRLNLQTDVKQDLLPQFALAEAEIDTVTCDDGRDCGHVSSFGGAFQATGRFSACRIRSQASDLFRA